MLTGKTRYRSGLFNRLVLQVEETKATVDRHDFEEGQFAVWRDAKVEDLCVLTVIKAYPHSSAHSL